ncbi:MAG: hypothetical protein GWN08_07770, partial [Gemmatimonadetes bacterium]|nr:hypothetical protein [Gemmatimonadota bacterium]
MTKVEAKMTSRLSPLLALLLAIGSAGCNDEDTAHAEETAPAPAPEPPPDEDRVMDSRPPPMDRPVDHWADGELQGQVDAAGAARRHQVLLELGDDWTPYIFTERGNESEPAVDNTYRETYLALAAGEFPDDHH